MTSATSASGVGSVLGERYELTRHVAAGAVTDLYEGLDRSLRRPVAVKVYRAGGPADRSRFDAEVAALLEDPGVRVYDAGTWSPDGGYVVVELADEPVLLSSAGDDLRPVPAAVVGDGAVDGDAPTKIVAVGGDTSVMPAILRPEPPSDNEVSQPARSTVGTHPALWGVLAAIALVVVLLAAQGGGGIEAPTPTTEPVEVTSPLPPSTTLPPTTEAPVTEPSGKGKGHGRDKGDD